MAFRPAGPVLRPGFPGLESAGEALAVHDRTSRFRVDSTWIWLEVLGLVRDIYGLRVGE